MLPETDITDDERWVEEQTDRLIAWELLQHSLAADYAPIEPAVLADRIGAGKNITSRIIKHLQATINERL